MFIYKLLTVAVVFPELLCVHPLHKLVKNYQTIHKDEVHHSWKRSTTLLQPIRVIRLLLWKQVIELHVSRNPDLFHPTAVAMEIDESGKARQHPINAHQFYIGQISDDARSRVKLHVAANGILTASITTENDVIYIEPASQYLNDDENMFVYNRSRIIPRETTEREHFCGLKDDHDTMTTFDNELRKRQAVETPSITNANTGGRICLMHLVSDYQFFSTWGRNRTSSTIINLANLVETADFIYRNTVWEPGLTNLGLQVGNITIYTSPGCVTYNQPTSPKGDRWTPQILLQEFSYNDWRAYCLAHLFTNRNFESDALGLAYVSSPNPSQQGGICSSYRRQLPGGDPSRPGTANVGMSSFGELQGRQLLQPEAEYIFTHEVGHNWGSQHDTDTPECNPPFGKDGGKYIMYASVVSGNEPNNKRFSICSRRSIARVLRSRSTCFKQRTQSLCGNYRVEPGEQCDEGLENFGKCFTGESDSCCRDDCTFKPGAVCSDRNQPCCQGCQAAPANSTICYVENDIDCLESVYCNGVNFSCPLPVDAKQNGSNCIDNGLCILDEVGNISCRTYCQHMYNMEPCICPIDSQECYYCCLNTTDGVCSVALPQLQLPNGKPCQGGVCVDGQCNLRNADLSTRLYNFLQSLSSDALRTLIRENIVFAIIILSLIPYTTISILICCMDRYTERKYGPLFRKVIQFTKLKQLQQKSRESSADTTDNTTMPLIH